MVLQQDYEVKFQEREIEMERRVQYSQAECEEQVNILKLENLKLLERLH